MRRLRLLIPGLLAGLIPLLAIAGSSAARSHPFATALVRTVRTGYSPEFLAVDVRTSRVFVVNAGSDTLSTLDARTGKAVRTVGVDDRPGPMAVDAMTRRVFLSSIGCRCIDVLDAATGVHIRTVRLAGIPTAPVVDQKAALVLVPSYDRPIVSILDARTGAFIRAVVTGQGPSALAVDVRHRKVFVTNDGEPFAHVFDLSRHSVARAIMVVRRAGERLDGLVAADIAFDAPADRVFLVASSSFAPRLPYSGEVIVLSESGTHRIRTLATHGAPQELAITDHGRHVLVDVLSRTRNGLVAGLELFDARRGSLLRRTVLPGGPTDALVVDQPTNWVFVVYARTGTGVSVVDASTLQPLRTVAVSGTPMGAAVDNITHRLFIAVGPIGRQGSVSTFTVPSG